MTRWERDVQGRVTREVRADGVTATSYTYEATTSRLKTVTDPKGQVTTYSYALDDQLTDLGFTNAEIPTPSVSYTYDSNYPRIETMIDGTGTTAYTYKAPGTSGAGQLASVAPRSPTRTTRCSSASRAAGNSLASLVLGSCDSPNGSTASSRSS